MKLGLSLLAALFAGNVVNAEYTVEIPDDAIWVTDWEQYHVEAPKFNKMVLYKYGGFVVEVDDKIVLATDEEMTKQLYDLLTELDKDDPDAKEEPQTSKRRDRDLGGLEKRRCSFPPCFNTPLCYVYTDCHVCTGLVSGPPVLRGRCI